MKNMITSLLIYILILVFTSIFANRMDYLTSKPAYGRKVLVSNHSYMVRQHDMYWRVVA